MAKTRTKKAKKPGLWAQTKQVIRSRLVSGFVVIVPLGVTALVINFLYNFTVGRFSRYTSMWFGRLPDYAVPAVSLVLFCVLMYIVGVVATAVVGRRLIHLVEAIIQRIPLVATVYGSTKQIVETVSFDTSGSNMKAAVFVEFPYPGMRAVGFMTGTIRDPEGRLYYKIFMPTAPNISVGLYLLCKPEDVLQCEMSVEDAVRMVVSVGIFSPERLKLTRMSDVQKQHPPGKNSPKSKA